MTRRLFLAMPLIAAVPDTPRNRLCVSANDFNAQYVIWANGMNDKQGTVNAAAVEAFQSLPNLWRKVEHAFSAWLKGF